jgi:serine/threonine protein phosphatase PrpC
MVIVESAGISHIGKKRDQNQDSMFLDDDMGLYVVADGMGGHLAGEIASKIVVETIGDHIRQFKENELSEKPVHTDERLSAEANQLLSGIRLSNHLVHHASLNNQSYRGMGSTVSAVYFSGKSLIAANVGDSPIYLIRNRKIKLLSVLHTVFAEQTALDPEYGELIGSEFKHVLTRAMGVEESVQAHINEIGCHKNDILVISSDGLSDKASPTEILTIVSDNDSGKACRKLIDLANERGGDDNITAIVLKVKTIKNTRSGIREFISRISTKLFNPRFENRS